MEYTASQKRQNVRNSPTAIQLDNQGIYIWVCKLRVSDTTEQVYKGKIRKQWNSMAYINT